MIKFLSSLLLIVISFDALGAEKNVVLTTDMTWASRYIMDGFDIGNDSPVWHLTEKADFVNSGFSVMFWTSLQANRNRDQYDEYDLFAMYTRNFFSDESYEVNLHGYFDYWMFPHAELETDEQTDSRKRGNKFQLGVSFPKVWSLDGSPLVPSYNLYRWLYWKQNREDLNQSGSRHEVLLEYFHPIRKSIPGATYQYAGGSTSISYNDGAFGVRPGLSHVLLSFESGVYVLKSIFILSLNHQWSLERTVNAENEFWTTFSYVKKL